MRQLMRFVIILDNGDVVSDLHKSKRISQWQFNFQQGRST
jgi:hypothetical protein